MSNRKKAINKFLLDFTKLYDIPTQERVLDYWCKLTGRDIFIMYPTNKNEKIKYLNKEILTTIKLYAKQNNKMDLYNAIEKKGV